MKHCLLKLVVLVALCAGLTSMKAQEATVKAYFLENEVCLGGSVAGVSPNGRYVVGFATTDFSGLAFIWDRQTKEITQITGSVDEIAEAHGVTNEGLVVGKFNDEKSLDGSGLPATVPGYWENGEWTALPRVPGVPLAGWGIDGFAFGISADGKTIGGTLQHRIGKYTPVIWKEGVLQELNFDEVNLGQGGMAYCMTSDCKVIGGWAEHDNGARSPTIWKEGKAQRLLGEEEDPIYFFDGQVKGISKDGKYVVGYFSQNGTPNDSKPFIWSEEKGAELYSGSGMIALVSNNGTAFGADGYMGNGAVFKDGEMISLVSYLEEKYNCDLSDLEYPLGTVMAMSEDESVIAGWTPYASGMGIVMMPYIIEIDDPSAMKKEKLDEVTVSVYPNPVEEILNIEGKYDYVTIYNGIGSQVVSADNSGQVELRGLDSGIYLVRVVSGESTKTFKVNKK